MDERRPPAPRLSPLREVETRSRAAALSTGLDCQSGARVAPIPCEARPAECLFPLLALGQIHQRAAALAGLYVWQVALLVVKVGSVSLFYNGNQQ